MIKDFFGLVILLISFFWHEVGHILLMKDIGIFKGLELKWYGVECLVDKEADIEVSFFQAYGLYLIGFFLSFVPFPVWVFLGYPAIVFFVFQVGSSLGDFYSLTKMIVYNISFNKNEGMKSEF